MQAKLQLEVSEAFEVGCERAKKGSAKRIAQQDCKTFWNTEANHYATKQGCYVFGLRAGKGCTPWYVGKTKDQSFKKECFGHFQLHKYNDVLFRHNGTPVIYFVAGSGNKNVLPKRIINELEHFLIQQGRYANPNIRNTAHAKEPEWGIKGVIRSGKGKPDTQSKNFCKMMGL